MYDASTATEHGVGRPADRGVVYVRRSTNHQETGIHVQLAWAVRRAAEVGVTLDADPAAITDLIAAGRNNGGDLYLDSGVTGADLTRPGFTAMRRRALTDARVSHVFIHMSDRFARPEQAVEAMRLENQLAYAGVTLVFQNRVAPPRRLGLDYTTQDIQSLLAYSESGEYLRRLAHRVTEGMQRVAADGHHTGGPPPYGFGRELVDASGQVVCQLQPGERTTRPGCHIRIAPRDPERVARLVWILDKYGREEWGLRRIAKALNEQGVPSPNADRSGVSGRWTAGTIRGLVSNTHLVGTLTFGRRGVGHHRRADARGVRLLTPADRHSDDTPKRVVNPTASHVIAVTGADAVADAEVFAACQAQLEARGRSTRGVPRASDPGRYPLSGLVYDDQCGSRMTGRSHYGHLHYTCGLYQRTDGARCEHNTVDAEAALRFTLAALRQAAERVGGRDAVARRLRELAEAERSSGGAEATRTVAEITAARREADRLQGQLDRIDENLALAASDPERERIRRVYQRKQVEHETALARLASAEADAARYTASDPTAEVERALAGYDDLERVASDPAARAMIRPVLAGLGLRLDLRYDEGLRGTRPVRRLLGGVLSLGVGPTDANDQQPADLESGTTDDDGGDDLNGPRGPASSPPSDPTTPDLGVSSTMCQHG